MLEFFMDDYSTAKRKTATREDRHKNIPQSDSGEFFLKIQKIVYQKSFSNLSTFLQLPL